MLLFKCPAFIFCMPIIYLALIWLSLPLMLTPSRIIMAEMINNLESIVRIEMTELKQRNEEMFFSQLTLLLQYYYFQTKMVLSK